jgi:hypothetical protein
MQGAGHNFGVVTSVTTKVYDVEHTDWAIDTIVFSGDKVEKVYEAANRYILQGGKQAADLNVWSYWMNDATVDSEKVRFSKSLDTSTESNTGVAGHRSVHNSRGCHGRRRQVHFPLP